MEQRRGLFDRDKRGLLIDPVNSVLVAKRLSRSYASQGETVHAVREVSFSADAGDFVCIYGASGSGKSTLLSLLAGIQIPDRGDVEIMGRSLGDLSVDQCAAVRLTSIGMVFQNDNLIEEFTALENVAFPLELKGERDRKAIRKEAEEGLVAVGLTDLGHRYPHELSGGQQQRVGIARALVGDRRLLLTDEPTGSLDSENSTALYGLLAKLCAEGATVVMSSHDPEAHRHASKVLHMVDGELYEQ